MFKVLDQKERAVAIGQAEVDKACKMFQSAAAAAESAQVRRHHHKPQRGFQTGV